MIPQEIALPGGTRFPSVETELGEIAPPATIISVEAVSYVPPAATGTDNIEVTDELDSSASIRVEVLSAPFAVESKILPIYAVLVPA